MALGALLPSIIGAGSTILGGLLGSSSAKEQNKAAANESQQQRDFQERMSSTAHQREVNDLRAAGLNPILSAHGGASSPGGAMAPVVNEKEPLRQSMLASAQLMAQNQLLKAQTEATNAQTLKTEAETQSLTGGTVGLFGTKINLDNLRSMGSSALSHVRDFRNEQIKKRILKVAPNYPWRD